jgi:tetratricopeptide (TPR) repeat protein
MLLGVGLPLREAHADRKAETKAKAFYLEGQKAYDIGDFPRAIDNFKKAYDTAPKPGLLFNIAQAYRLSGDGKQALFFYRNYLRQVPDAGNRADVEDWIAKLEAAEVGPTPSPTPSPSPSASPEPGLSDEPLTPGGKIPPPESIPENSGGLDLGPSPSPSDHDGSPPVYKRWWFWTGGVVIVGVATYLILQGTKSSGPDYPDTHFPTVEVP